MAPEASNHRESNSFDDILDNTNPEKLVQIIREKRGLQNAKRIFPEANIEKRRNKRKSFPFEIQAKPLTPPATNVESTNENSVNVANPKVIPKGRTQNEDQTDNKNESVNESQLRLSKSKTSVRRSSHNLGRRVLLKAFEKIQKEDNFCPVASSTPMQRNAPCEEFPSVISNINRDSGDEESSSISGKNIEEQRETRQQVKKVQQEYNKEESFISETDQQHKSKHNKCKSHRKSETIKQPKTITESLLCQSHEVYQNINEQPRDHHGTQLYDDGIEVDETLIGPSPVEIALPLPNNTANVENENNLTEGTLINEEIFDAHDETPSSTAKSLEVRKDANKLTFTNKEIHQERTSINITRNKTINESNKVQSSRQSQPGIPLNNPSTENYQASNTRRSEGENIRGQHFSANSACAELVSAIANKLRQSKDRESNILVPPSPFRSGYSPCRSQGASFSVQPTQSPQIQPIHVSFAKSPTYVIPIYSPSCHQKNKTTETPTTPTVVSSVNRRSDNAAANDAPEILNTRNHKRASDQKNSEKLRNQFHLSSKHSKSNLNSSIVTRTEPEITSDEDNSREQMQYQQSIDVHHPDSVSDKETIAHQSRAVDLRLPSLRSQRLSLQSNMSRSRVYEKNKSQNVSINSESFEDIIKIDKMLKKLNSTDSTNHQPLQPNEESPVAKTIANVHLQKKNNENVQMQTKSHENELYLNEIDENIIEPVGREDAGCGYVYDLSPRLGKLYMESLFKSGRARATLNTKPRRRRRNTQNSPPLPHDDIALIIQRQLKSRKSQKLSCNRQSRRKLYTKGNSEMDNLSDDETQPFENTTHIHDATAASQQSIYDKKSKISKCRIPPKPVIFHTIQQLKEKWAKSDPASPTNIVPKRKKEPTKIISDDDELLFKVPEKPPPKRKTFQSRVDNRVGSNIKQVLGLRQNKSRNGEGHDSSDTSSDESGFSENLRKCKENEVSKQLNIVAASEESSFVQAKRSSAGRNVERERSRRTNSSFGVERLNTIANESLSRSKECVASSSLTVIEEISDTIPDSSKNHMEQEQPVEPELTNDKITHTMNTSTTPLLRISMQNTSKCMQKNIQNCSRRDNQSESCENKSVDKQNASTNEYDKSCTAEPIFAKHSGRKRKIAASNLEANQTSNKSSSSNQTSNSDVTLKKRSRKPRIAVSNLEANQTSNKSSSSNQTSNSDVTLKKRSRKPRIAVSNLEANQTSNESSSSNQISNKSSSSNSTDNQGSTSLRRSARKHRPPQPYWTSRFIRSDEICYKVYVPRRKRRTRMESISEYPEYPVAEPKESQQSAEEHPPASCLKHKDPQQLADDLFDAVKELSINNQTLAEASKLPAPKTTRVLKSKRKHNLRTPTSDTNSANEGASNSEEHILTDSGHRTDSSLEAQDKSKNLLLSWLKNLVEPNTISANPAIRSIFELSGAEIVPASTLVFRESDGVEYAYYTKNVDGNLYGYMRFHPGSVKRKAKTRACELKILNITGELLLYIGAEEGRIIHGDFVSVPKSTTYSIANQSDEMALAFFIKFR